MQLPKDHLSLNGILQCSNNQLRMVYTLSSTYIVPRLRLLELARAPNLRPVASTLPYRTKCASGQVLLFGLLLGDQLRGRAEFEIFMCYRGQHILEGNLLQSLEYVVHFSSNVQTSKYM